MRVGVKSLLYEEGNKHHIEPVNNQPEALLIILYVIINYHPLCN